MTTLENLKSAFEAAACASNAAAVEKYMRNKAKYYGIKQPLRKEISKDYIRTVLKKEPDELEDEVKNLWNMPMREYVYVAIDILDKYCSKSRKDSLGLYESLILKKSWWDTVDMLAQKHVGTYFLLYPESKLIQNAKWLGSGNIWLQRTAILFQNRYKTKTDEDLLFDNCIKMSNTDEFFIQKAIGWALREYSKTNPGAVHNFVSTNPLSGLAKREALRIIKS